MSDKKSHAQADAEAVASHPKLFDVGTPIPVPPPVPVPEEPVVDNDATIPIPFDPVAGATISDDGLYRYCLWRAFLPKGETVMYVGLNPSTADAENDDPTVRRWIYFAKRDGFARMIVANIFAFRATDPTKLKWAEDPIGPDNDTWLIHLQKQVSAVVCCWGCDGAYRKRGKIVTELLSKNGNLFCFGETKHGHPRHPLYLSNKTKIVSYPEKWEDIA